MMVVDSSGLSTEDLADLYHNWRNPSGGICQMRLVRAGANEMRNGTDRQALESPEVARGRLPLGALASGMQSPDVFSSPTVTA